MRRGVLELLLWAAATFVAVVIIWFAVQLAADRLRDATLSSTVVSASSQGELLPARSEDGERASAVLNEATTDSGISDGDDGVESRPEAAPSANAEATAPAIIAPAASPTPVDVNGEGTVTFDLDGGAVMISYTDELVTVLWTRPNRGFRAAVDVEDPTSLRVRFESDVHTSELRAWWDAGPRDQIEETDT